jgi:AcrR family transcriptional regulator
MSDVAAAAGVSVGTLYNYVDSKEALLQASALAAFGDLDVDVDELPYSVPDRRAVIERLRAAVRDRVIVAALDEALGREGPASPDEIEVVLGELFDLLADTREVADAFERCATEAPDLAEVFYRDARGRLLRQLETFVSTRTLVGRDATSPSPELVARHVLETTTWLARHRHHDPELDLDDHDARRTALALLTVTLTAGAR